MALPQIIERKFGDSVVRAKKSGCRYLITLHLLWNDGPDAVMFRDALQHLEQSTGWTCNGGQSSLVEALCTDWEPAAIFVALNLDALADYAQGKTAFFKDAGDLIWYVMRVGEAC